MKKRLSILGLILLQFFVVTSPVQRRIWIAKATPTATRTSTQTATITPASSFTPTSTQAFTPTRTNTPLPGNSPTNTPTVLPSNNSFFVSFALNGTVNGISFADEDILGFDGQIWSLLFDGSDIGAGSVDLFALWMVDPDSILMAFSSNITLNGLAVTPQDIVRFDAASLGENTAGTFSMYFNGVDVGLDASGEKIDALSVLPDGRILISITGDISVPGATGKDEDAFAFTPSSLGNNTSGSWAIYFDGSDVGLTDTSGEDVDAFDVVGGNIYLSTAGAFSVNGVAGAGEDIFVCTPTALGDVTACNYASALFFDGSNQGLGGNSVDGLYLTTTQTPTPTITVTQTPTQIVTSTRTPTPIFTMTQTATRTPTPAPGAMGPLKVSTVNSRYFGNPNGTIVFLTGSHTWCNLMDCDDTNPIVATFNYTAFLDFLVAKNHNFFRLWRAENARGGEGGPNFWFNPMPYARSSQCCAFDGGNKFDLTQFNQAYFDRMRQRVIAAGNRGIYVSIMLFDGWSVESKFSGHNPWDGHPYKLSNNINNVNGDTNNNNQGSETHTLASPQITALQEAYVRKVIDTVNDLDNVLYEISNESPGNSEAWQNHFITFIKNYETSKPKQHPVGMTVEWPNGSNTDLFNSPADWISPNGDLNNPALANGTKVILADTDHLCGICGNRQWVWKSFTRGENPIFMDIYDNATSGRGMPFTNPNEVEIRNNLGYVRTYTQRMNLAAMLPSSNSSHCSTGYCLRNPALSGAEYFAYLPSGGSITINLSATQGMLTVEWFNPANGATIADGTVSGGANRQFTAPFGGDAVLYLKSTTP